MSIDVLIYFFCNIWRMKHSEFRLDSAKEGTSLHCVSLLPDGEPICAFLVVHGMMEHITRHGTLANELCSRGVAVYGYDQLGHGHTGIDDLGYISDSDGDRLLTEDCRNVFSYMASRHPGIPHVIMGHSMGSFIVRRLLAEGLGPDAAVLTATGDVSTIKVRIGQRMVKGRCRKNGSDDRDPRLNEIVVGSQGVHFNQSGEQVKDPLSGFLFSNQGLGDLLRLVGACGRDCTGDLEGMPILLSSGALDPLGDCGAGTIRVAKHLRDSGADVEVYLYAGAKHNLFRYSGGRAEADIARWVARRFSDCEKS